jgi:hypothetical protein
VVDAKTGKIIWKANRETDPRWIHAHMGWAADIWEDSPGMEILTNRDGHTVRDTVLFSADGKDPDESISSRLESGQLARQFGARAYVHQRPAIGPLHGKGG